MLNYYPGVGPADARYARRRRAVSRVTSSALAASNATANATKSWRAHQPNKRDCVSAGVTLMQLAVVGLREPARLDACVAELEALDWVAGSRAEKSAGTGRTTVTALDANGGAGWALAAALVVPDRKARVSAEEALNHAFFG